MLVIALVVFAIGLISSSQAQTNPPVYIVVNVQYDECMGKDSANYTLWGDITIDPITGNTIDSEHQLIQCGPNQQRAVNSLRIFAITTWSAGAYTHGDALWLVTGGPLQGKYVYEKIINLSRDYLKRYSSVLGYSYIPTKSATLLISDHLDVSVLISPTGAFEAFKRGCNTQCSGRGWRIA